jgi:ABC-type branched-subunit amino acid transport system substrate-binding protein
MGELLGGVSRVDAVIGPGCSSACEVTSYLSAGQGIPQVSWGCEAPELSSRAFFVRTVAPVASKGPALIAFMQHNKWKRAVMLCSTESLWLDSGLGLQKQLKTAGIEALRLEAFEPGDFKAATLLEIRQIGFRIVLILSYDTDAQSVASIARKEGMTNGWGWLRPWAAVGSADMHGWLHIAQLLPSEGMLAFAKQVSDYSKSHFKVVSSPDSVDLAYSAALHDAVMLYAHAATAVMSKGGDLHNGRAVAAAVHSTKFTGVGGTVVALDSNGDRMR